MEILVYGAGYYGRKLCNTIKKYSDIEISAYIDKREVGDLEGYPIWNLNDLHLKDYERNIPVVVAIADWQQISKICKELNAIGFTYIYYYLHKNYCYGDNFLENECANLSKITDYTLIYAEMHLVDFCNLNCKGCTHFSPLFEKKIPDFIEKINDVKKIDNIFDNVVIFNMMGGEPLLNPQIEDYIVEIRKILPHTELQLVTNGLLIPKLSNAVLRCMEENKITVGISEYEPTHKVIDLIKQKLEEYHIDYFIREYDKKQKFMKPMSLSNTSIYPQKCISPGCVNIWEGKIAKCPTLMYVGALNDKFQINLTQEGVLELDDKMDGKKLLKKLEERVPLCDHCIEYEIEWERCHLHMLVLEDFVTYN